MTRDITDLSKPQRLGRPFTTLIVAERDKSAKSIETSPPAALVANGASRKTERGQPTIPSAGRGYVRDVRPSGTAPRRSCRRRGPLVVHRDAGNTKDGLPHKDRGVQSREGRLLYSLAK